MKEKKTGTAKKVDPENNKARQCQKARYKADDAPRPASISLIFYTLFVYYNFFNRYIFFLSNSAPRR